MLTPICFSIQNICVYSPSHISAYNKSNTYQAEKAESLAKAAEKAFKQFDTDGDGEISVSELKAGLEKVFKVILITTQCGTFLYNPRFLTNQF